MFRTPPYHRLAAATLTLSALAATGCNSIQPGTDRLLGFITPYRVDVLQGNVVTQEMAARIKPGMSRDQVRDVLGSPLLTDPFHNDRWDYVFTMRRKGAEPQRRSVVAYFNGDVLDRVEAPELPSEKEFVSSIRPPVTGGKEPVLALTDAQREALPLPAKAEATAAALPQGATRPYPPLERQ
jgi:outer membrane protein assembly factor BamE